MAKRDGVCALLLTVGLCWVAGCGANGGLEPGEERSASPQVLEVETLFRERAAAERFSGVVLVAVDGEVALEVGYGWAEYEHSVEMAPDQIFRIGSLTKPLTASVVLLAARAGRLSLDQPVCALVEGCPVAWREVTIEHLLTHTSGIEDHFGDLEAVPVEETVAELGRVMAALSAGEALDTPAGETYAYRNFNYVLLGAALETVYRKPWEEVLRDLVFEPLGLGHTAYDRVEQPVRRRARGYDRAEDGSLRHVDYDDHAAYAAGGLYSTAQDLFAWSTPLFAGDLLGEFTESTFTPLRGNYGYGWQIRDFFDRRVINHTGGIDGFSSHIAHYPDEGLTLIVLSNVESDSAILSACDAAAVWFDWRYPEGTESDRTSLPGRVRCGLAPASS